MTHGMTILTLLAVMAVPASVLGAEREPEIAFETAPAQPSGPSVFAACTDDVCRVTATPPEASAAVTAPGEPSSSAAAEAPARVVCHEAAGECRVVDATTPIEDLLASATGRLVYGAADDDPSGDWKTINLPTVVRCKVAGAGTSVSRIKRTQARGSIERLADGRLRGRSASAEEPPFELARLGPGLYGTIQPFARGSVKGEIVSYFGMLDADTIVGTSSMTSTSRAGGAKTVCTMQRNFDMRRVKGEAPSEAPVESPRASEVPA